MPSFTEFDERMKAIEHADRMFVKDSPYYIIRLDGKAFHTYTRGMKSGNETDPFYEPLHDAFVKTGIELGKEVEGAIAIYTQSDELSILVKGYEDDPSRTPWFGGNVQKWVSVTASIMTAVFNERMRKTTPDLPLAYFDSRVFSIQADEVNNYLVWRQKDAIRNSISMYAQKNFSHKKLQGKKTGDMLDMLEDKDLYWSKLEGWKQRGTLMVRKKRLIDSVWTDKKGDNHTEKDVERSQWESVDLPLFTDENIFGIITEHSLVVKEEKPIDNRSTEEKLDDIQREFEQNITFKKTKRGITVSYRSDRYCELASSVVATKVREIDELSDVWIKHIVEVDP